MKKVLIFVDKREAGIVKYFAQYDCEVREKMLLYGDFLVSERVCIERKTVKDFVKSIMDKRLFQQLKTMKENFENPLLVVEGEESLYGFLNPNVIRGALASIAIDLSIPIIWTRDPADTAGIVFWIAKREQINEKREVILRNKKIPLTIKEQQEYLIGSLPDISRVRAKQLLKHFKTPKKIFNASKEELKKVRGIGEKIAEKILKILEKEYE